MLKIRRRMFESDRVSDQETFGSIKVCFKEIGYVLDPHTALAIAAAKRSTSRWCGYPSHLFVDRQSCLILTGYPIGPQR